MSLDLDVIARRAAANLKAAVEAAPLNPSVPGQLRPRSLARLAFLAACFVMAAAVGLALVIETPPVTVPTTLPGPGSNAPAVTSTTAEAPPTTSSRLPISSIPPKTSSPAPVPPDTTPPFLHVTSPEDGMEFTERNVTFAGTTEPGTEVFAGQFEAAVDAGGSWQIVLILSEGANPVRLTARDGAGNESYAAITVYYSEPATTTPTVVEKEPSVFEAHAMFGTCNLTPPYDIYYGTGQPGSTIHVQSEFGSGSVMVNSEGQWELQVFFPTAEPGRVFPVKVFDTYGRQRVFEFQYTP
ncbi:MAG: hypothetical protein ACT4OP_13425 [Actinomycetota bacterium]